MPCGQPTRENMANILVGAPDPKEVAERPRAAAASGPEGSVALLPGLTDEEMDSWKAPVPEEIRVLLRSTGGLRIQRSAAADRSPSGKSKDSAPRSLPLPLPRSSGQRVHRASDAPPPRPGAVSGSVGRPHGRLDGHVPASSTDPG